MKELVKVWLLLSVLSGHASTQAGPPDKHHEVQLGPGHALKLWFKPKHGWRAKSYDQRYPGCTRQQEHGVYTADDGISLPDLLKNPNNLHWLSDPEGTGQKALYIGQLGLAGGMPPSKHVKNQAKKDLSAMAVEAIEQGKMGVLRRAIGEAEEGADFDSVYEQVFGEGSSEEADLAIFDLTVGEVRELSGYSELFSGSKGEEQGRDTEDKRMVRDEEGIVLSPTDLVEGLYAPAQSEKHRAACRVLTLKKYQAAYSTVLPLTAGLLYKRYVDGKDEQAYGLSVFWRCLLSGPRELVGIHQVTLNMRCMEACGADAKGVLAKLHKPILDDIMSWVLAAWDMNAEQGLTPALFPVLEEVWHACPCMLSYRPLVKGILVKLRTWNRHAQASRRVDLGTLRTLTRLFSGAWVPSIREAALDYVSSGCRHASSDVRSAAARALSQALESNCSNEAGHVMLELLRGLCKDEDWKIRSEAAAGLSKALQRNCSKGAWKGILESLTDLCKDHSGWVRGAATGALSQALQSNCSEEAWHAILESLTDLCRDRHWSVGCEAAEGLSQALEGVCSEEVWKAILASLIGLCEDESYKIRKATALGLSKALKKNYAGGAWKGIIESLTGLCRDRHWNVRSEAAVGLSKALGGVCSEEVWEAILELLKGLCKDDSEWVRSEAAGALSKGLEGSFSEKSWQVIVEILTGLCRDEDWEVRQAAARGLSKGLEGACSEEAWKGIVTTLTGLCQDRESWVRLAAALGLSKGLEGASAGGCRAILGALTSSCRNDHWEVHYAVAGGLSKALDGSCSEGGWKAILEALTRLSQDEHPKVREATGGLSEELEGSYSEGGWKIIVKALTRLSQDEHPKVREAVAGALPKALRGKCSEGGWKVIVEVLNRLCGDKHLEVRCAAVGGLSSVLEGKCSDEAWQDIMGILWNLCKDDEWMVRRAAALGLSKGLEGACPGQAWEGIVEALTCLSQDANCFVRHAPYDALTRLLCSGHGDESILHYAFTTLFKGCNCAAWDVPGPVYESLRDLVFGKLISKKVREAGFRMLCESCDEQRGSMRRLAVDSFSRVLLGSKLSLRELQEGLLVLFGARIDVDLRGIADHALVCLMDKHQELLVDMLMGSDLPSLTLIEAMTSYNPCLLLPDQCDSEVSGRIKRSFSQERKERGWPEALLSVEDLPSSVPSKKDKGIFMESDKLEE